MPKVKSIDIAAIFYKATGRDMDLPKRQQLGVTFNPALRKKII